MYVNKNLEFVLKAKMIINILLWCIPPLFFPIYLFQELGFPLPQPIVNLRLLGIAYTALGINYYYGLRELQSGKYPQSAVVVGIVSNGGATIVLLFYAIQNSWATWGILAQTYMWISLGAVFCITLGLLLNSKK